VCGNILTGNPPPQNEDAFKDLPEENSFSMNVGLRIAAAVAAAAEKEIWWIYQGE